MHFDVIPKAVDEYHQQLRAYETQDANARLNNPVWHIHAGNVPKSGMVVPFSMLLNLASVVGAKNKHQLWGFIKRYAPDAAPDTNSDLDAAVEFAVRYYDDFVKPTKTYRAPNDLEAEALRELLSGLKTWNQGLDSDALQSLVFSCGRERFDPMRDWFKALYEVLLGASQGPRFGGFLALLGIQESIVLIEKCLARELS